MDFAAIAGIFASVFGALLGAGKDAQAQALREKMVAQYGPEILPHLDRAVAEQQGSTEFGKIHEDDSLISRQRQTLMGLQNEYDTGGNTAADRAANQLALGDATAANESNQRGIENSMATRGMAGGPGDFALKQQSAQGATNMGARMAQQNSGDARMRALQALEAGGKMAGDVRTQDYRRLSDIAGAQDAINNYNTGARGAANSYNRQLPQQQFDNAMLLNNARANAANGVAAGYERGGQADRATGAGVGQGLITWGTQNPKKKSDGSDE